MYIHLNNVTSGFYVNNERFKAFSVSGNDEKYDNGNAKQDPVTLQIRNFFSSKAMEINNGTKTRVSFYI